MDADVEGYNLYDDFFIVNPCQYLAELGIHNCGTANLPSEDGFV